jgi:hypothetical protein
MSSSPRKTYRLTRDKFNNPLWTGRRRSAEEDEQNQQLAKFRKSFSGGMTGEAGMKELLRDKRRREADGESSGDSKLDAADALFSMLESNEAYVPTKGRDATASPADAGKKKGGVRT